MKKLLSLSAMLLAALFLITGCAGADDDAGAGGYSTDDCTETTDTFNPADGNWTVVQKGRTYLQGSSAVFETNLKVTIANNQKTVKEAKYSYKFKTEDVVGGKTTYDFIINSPSKNDYFEQFKEAYKLAFERLYYIVENIEINDSNLSLSLKVSEEKLNTTLVPVPSTSDTVKTNKENTKYTWTSTTTSSGNQYTQTYIYIKE